MCTHKMLTNGNYGYIVLCHNCNHFQIAFGTSLINLKPDHYNEFYLLAQEQHHYYQNNGFPNNKTIHLPIFTPNSLMVLSFNELELLLEMFNKANLMLEVDAILNETSIN